MHQLSVLETAVTTMGDIVVSIRGLLGALVRGLQSDSASRLGLATIATTPTPAPVIAPRATLVQSSNDAPVYEISSMKSLVAKTVMVNYIMYCVADAPHNLVIKNARYPERDRIRIVRVMDFMMAFATSEEKLDLKAPQPPKSNPLWITWFNCLKGICDKLQERSMAAILHAEQQTMTAAEIGKSKQKDPYISAMDARIGMYVDKGPKCGVKRSRSDTATDAAAGYTRLFSTQTITLSASSSSSASSASSSSTFV